MSDLAYYLIEEAGALGEVPTHLQNYIDYEAYGRDLEIEGNYLVTSRGVFELSESILNTALKDTTIENIE